MRLLFISIEFVDPIFSGNGVYSRSIVRMLAQKPNVSVLVLCGRDGAADDVSAHGPVGTANAWGTTDMANVEVMSVPLSTWRKLDRASAWQQFAAGFGASDSVAASVKAFAPALTIGVDWTSVDVYRALNLRVPFTFFNFRVYYAR